MPANQWNVAIVADDLTGAGDTAVQFACEGWPALVTPHGEAVPDGQHEVVAVATGARALPAVAAEAATAEAVHKLAATDRLYLKVDSALRGSVSAQVAGALRARPGAFAVVCTAYPAMGRTIADGRAYVHGVALAEGPAGRDPVTPVHSSLLGQLLPRSTHLTVDLLDQDAADGDVITVDATTDADLERLGATIAALGERVIPVGSAGLAGVLARQWREPRSRERPVVVTRPAVSGPIAVLISSQHQVAREQADRLRTACGGSLAETGLGQPAPGPDADVVLINPPDDAGNHDADEVARGLAVFVQRLHETAGFAAFILTGGDGARALLERFGCTGISVRGRVDEGIPHGVAIGGVIDGLPMVTKAGGFGGPSALVDAIQHLRGERGATA